MTSQRYLIQWLIFVILAAVFIPPVFSQSTELRDRSLEISGARLTLGMDQAQAFAKLRDANLLITGPLTSGSHLAYAICGSTDKNCDLVLGTITFRDGDIVTATKRWADNSKTISDFLTAFYGAATDFENRGLTQCRIVTKQELQPNQDSRIVNLFCGSFRYLSVSISKSPKTPQYVMIEEVLDLNLPK